ncbi:MAG TPA: hypothetical protein VFW98_11250, partial [Gemmatimonadaceae bacterium]|nr:hypothetical protein [Gemmatimonadaceae bacterium]
MGHAYLSPFSSLPLYLSQYRGALRHRSITLSTHRAMSTNRLQQLHDAGQSIWLDFIDRTILLNG